MPDGQGRAEATGGRRLEVSTADSTSEVPGCYHGSPHWLGPRDRKGVSRIGHFHPACSPTAERGGVNLWSVSQCPQCLPPLGSC